MLLEVCPQCKYSKVSFPHCPMKHEHKLLSVEVSVLSLLLSRSRNKHDRILVCKQAGP